MEEIIIENGCNPLMTLSTAAFIASEAEVYVCFFYICICSKNIYLGNDYQLLFKLIKPI